jgi:hypothetical protein
MASTSDPGAGGRTDHGRLPKHEGPPPPGRCSGSQEMGDETARLRDAGLAGILLVLVVLLAIYALVAFWPPAPPPPLAEAAPTTTTTPEPTTTTPRPTTTTSGETTGGAGTATPGNITTTTTVVIEQASNPPVHFLGWTFQVRREARLFLVVALTGALGGLVHALRSLAWYTGNRNLKYSWLLTYPLQPFIGAALATITYVVLRGGLVVVSSQASADVANPFGFAAFAGLVGLFSVQATEWLKRVFEQVFAPAPQGKDPAMEPRIAEFDPRHGPVGTVVTITGSGLSNLQAVMFNKVAATNVSRVSDTEVRAVVPEGATSGVITVVTAARPLDSPEPFEVDPPANGGVNP